MAHTTIADYEMVNRTEVPVELVEQVNFALQSAEDELLVQVGYTFWTLEEGGMPDRQWKEVVSWRAGEWMSATDAAFKAAVLGPFQSQTIGRYSYTLKAPGGALRDNTRYRAVIDYYRGLATSPVQYFAGSDRDEYER